MPGLFFDSGVDRGFENDLKRMNAKMNKFGDNVENRGLSISKTFKEIGRSVSGVVSVLAVGAAGKELIGFSQDLETALTEVATISSVVSDDFQGYKEALIALSTEQDLASSSAIDLADAYYDIVSAGNDGADGLKILEVAARAGTAGFVDASVAADGVTTVLNAWGKSADEAASVSDIFFETVERGKTTFPELGANINQVAPLAASLGVSFEEVSGAVSTITKQGVPTSQAFTQIRSALVGMNEELGDGWAESMTLQEAFQEISDRAGGSATEIQKLVGRVEGMSAILATTGDNAQTASEDLDAMTESLGATAAAAEKVAETTEQQVKALKNNILAALEPLGAEASEVIGNLAASLNEAFQSGDVEKYAKILLQLGKAFVVYKASVIAMNQVQKIRKNILLQNIRITEQMRLEYALSGKTASKNALRVAVANKRLASSFKTVSAAFKANPIGLIVTALTLAVPAIKNVVNAFESSEKKLSEINEEINKQFAEESAGLDVLQNQLDDANLTYDEKKKLIEDLNSQYGEYLPALLTENSTQEDINEAITAANEALREQIRLKILNQKATESAAKIYELESKIQEASKNKLLVGADVISDVLQARLLLFAKNLQQEKELYDKILDEISDSNKKATSKIKETTPSPVTGGVEKGPGKSPEQLRKDRLKQLELENQLVINSLIERYGKEEELQEELNKKLLENDLDYLQKKQKLSIDALEKAKIEEQIITTKIQLADTGESELDVLLKEFQTYTDKREAIEKEYQKNIDTLRKNGYEDQAKEAEEALEKELKALDESIVSGSLKFEKWMDTVLPDLAKQGITALQKELNDLEISLATSGLSEKDILIIKEQIKQLNKEIEKTAKVDTWKEVLDVMNDVNEFAENLISNFDGLDESTKNVATGIVDTVSGIIGLATAVKGVATAVGALEKASVILAVIAAAVQVVSAITKASAKAQELRNDALIREFETIQAINIALIEQNRLYQEGNELFSDDQWGTALAGLEAYNQALNAQVGILDDIKQGFLENIPNEAGARAAYEELLENFTSIDEVLSLIQIKTRDRSGFANFFGVGDEFAGLLDLYPEVIKANGDLDKEILQLIISTEELDAVQKANLENIVELIDQAEQSYAQFGDYISGIFGSVGDEIAQAFQTMYETGDDAMTALEGSFSDMIEKFTRDALEFTFLQPYLNELNNTTKELGEQFARGDITSDDLQKGIVGTLGGFYEDLNKIQPEILKAFATADELAAKAGFESAFNAPEEVVDTLEAGKTPEELSRAGRISEAITEETGSLLVGRMGAIMISNERIANFSADALDYAIQNLVTLNAIKKNTDYLPEIAENTRITAEKL